MAISGLRWRSSPTVSIAVRSSVSHSMRGLRTDRTAQVVITGLAFLQNLRRATTNSPAKPRTLRVAVAFTELATAI